MKIDEQRLSRISSLANEMKRLATEIYQTKNQLEILESQYNQISAIELPEIMSEVGMRHFALTDGTEFTVEPVLAISIKDGEMDNADKWLTLNGHDGMIKMQINLPRGITHQTLNDILTFIRRQQIRAEYKKYIHWQTLAKWGREMDAESMVIPEEIFNVFRSNKTTIG